MRTWRRLKRRTSPIRWWIVNRIAGDAITIETKAAYEDGADREWRAGGRQGSAQPLAWYLGWHDEALWQLQLLGVELDHEERLAVDLFLRQAYDATYYPAGAAKEYVELYYS